MNIVSLFAGAGGFDLGLIQSGHAIIWANDIDEDCIRTYSSNIGRHIVHGDIADIASEDIPYADAIVGGFPCQGFSLANLRRSISDKRNSLYLQFLRIVKDKRPKYFLAENVRGILSLDKGNVIKQIVADFESAGYRVQNGLFNVADYGVPQSRHRVIIAGTRSDLPTHCNFTFPEPTHGKRSGLLIAPWLTVSEALAGMPEPSDDPSTPNSLFSKYKITNRNFTGHRWTDPDKPSPTLLARGDGKGGVCAIQHPKNHRRLTVGESAIIQTFPPAFIFTGSMNSCYRQVGNAVPVRFAKTLGDQLSRLESRLLCE